MDIESSVERQPIGMQGTSNAAVSLPTTMVDNVFVHETEFFKVVVETHNSGAEYRNEPTDAKPMQVPNVVITAKADAIIGALGENNVDRISHFLRSANAMLQRVEQVRNGEFGLFEWD